MRRVQPRDQRAPAALLGVSAERLVVRQGRGVGPGQPHGLDEHLDGAAAGETDLPRLFISQVQLQELGGVVAEDAFGLLDHLGVHAAADGHRAQVPAAGPHQHLGPLLARGRAAGVDQRGQSHLFLCVFQFLQLLEELVHSAQTIPRRGHSYNFPCCTVL